MPDITSGIQRSNITLEAMQEVAKDEILEQDNEVKSSLASFAKDCEDTVNPFAKNLSTERKKIEARGPQIKKGQEAKDKSPQLLSLDQIKDKADEFQGRNPSLKKENLLILLEKIKPDDKAEEILKAVTESYPDVLLANDALDFLLETTTGDLHEQVKEAIQQFREMKGPEIAAGKNVAQQAMQATEKGLGTYTNLNDLYRDLTDNVRDASTLFEQLSQKYDFKELKAVMDFLLHNLGSNLKVKGTAIPRAELQRLVNATRSLQAISGVYRFFKNRMPLVEKLFKEAGEPVPAKLSFESLSKVFMNLVTERYPSSEKVKQQASRLGVEASVLGKIITFNQCRDGIREVALNQIYRSVQHRDELYLSLIDALEDMEEDLEDSIEVNEDLELDTKSQTAP